MDLYRALYEIAKSLYRETDQESLIRVLLDRVIEFTGADKGFIVLHEQGSFTEKYHVRFDRNQIPADKRRFSRSLVREAIRSGKILFSQDLSQEMRFDSQESIANFSRSSIMVAPLGFKGDIFAVIYLEKNHQSGPFTEPSRSFMLEFIEMTGLSLRRALEREVLEQFRKVHARDFLAQYNFEGFVGRHPEVLRLLETVAQIAPADAPVLLQGETGTGKELVAKALFLNSGRREKPFVTLHCGALPETLFESELFGHKRGAFTGASQDRVGRIGQAHGGTLFIDEIAETPLASQAKLLRFFQFGEFQRIGSDHVERVDVRIIAATHRDLKRMVAAGEFREDLYYRLNVLELVIPPLRERKGDIPLLVHHFLGQYSKSQDQILEFSREANLALENYDYPGNVRELAHLVERCCILARDPVMDLNLLPQAIRDHYHDHVASARTIPGEPRFSEFSNEELKRVRELETKLAVERVEKAFLNGLLERYEGNVSLAAKEAGMQRTYLYKLLSKYRD